MSRVTTPPSYFALRVCPRAQVPQWWTSARAATDAAPAALQAILAGRARVEVSAEEAAEALAWAEHVHGWNHDGLAPVWVYPATPELALDVNGSRLGLGR